MPGPGRGGTVSYTHLLLLGTSVLSTLLLYIGFAVFLGVMLPRGQVPFLRNFALFVESLIPAV